MIKIITLIFIAILCGSAFAEDANESSEIVTNSPPPIQPNTATQQAPVETEVITVYESRVFPGLRRCTAEEIRKQNNASIACQDEEGSLAISTRDPQHSNTNYIVEDDAVPQGNLFKLRFDRFRRTKK